MNTRTVVNTAFFLLNAIYGWHTHKKFLSLNLDGFKALFFAASGLILCLFLLTYIYLVGALLSRWILLGGYSLVGVASGALLAGIFSGQVNSSLVTVGVNILIWGGVVCIIGKRKLRNERGQS